MDYEDYFSDEDEKKIFMNNILSIQNLETKKFLEKNWDSVLQKGQPSRICNVIELEKVNIYRYPNNIAVAVLKDKYNYSLVTASLNTKFQKNQPFLIVDGEKVCLPFSAKLIEVNETDNKLNYVAIFLALE